MENYDFEKIPLWNGENNSFDILVDDINGRIPVTRVQSWKEFTELLEANFFNRPGSQMIFRGHRRFDWALMPTLARIPENGIIEEKLANMQLEYFRKAVRGRLGDNALLERDNTDIDDELWSVGQHHGLMTPLLDWTYSPYVALFFAFSKVDSEEEKENPYRAIYVLNKTFIADDEQCPDVRMFEPRRDDHGRLVNQAGLFTFSPYGSTIENKLIDSLTDENFPDDEMRSASLEVDSEGEIQHEMQAGVLAKYICKIYIKNEDRDGCMRHLRRMNVHHASLFPDLLGASEHCNLVVAEEFNEYEIKESSDKVTARLEKADEKERRIIEAASKESVGLQVDNVVQKQNVDSPELATNAGHLPFDEIVNLLKENEPDPSIEPGRFEAIANRLSEELDKYKLVDWESRDSVQAKIRNFVRVVLRDYSYPRSAREEVIDKIFTLMLYYGTGESAHQY